MLAAYVAEWIFDRVRPPAPPVQRPPRKQLVLAGGATLFACLVNPYGFRAVTLPIEQFHKVGSTGIYRASFVVQRRQACPSIFRLLLFTAAAYLGWQATRNSALFALVAAFVTAWNLDEAFPSSLEKSFAELSKKARRAGRGQQPKRNADPALLVAIVVLGIVTASGGLYAWAGEGRTVGLGQRKQWYAHDACAFLSRADLPERIVAFNLSQAAVCIAHAAPDHKVFMDPRLEVNTQETFERYLDGLRKLWRGQPDWEVPLGIDYARPTEIPAILVERGVLARAAEVLSRDPRWRCVYADPVAAVFVTTEFAEAHGLATASR